MTQANPSTALARVVIDELARNGVAFIVLSPGSRSGALAIAAMEHETAVVRVVIDERSAAFHALGRVKATGLPAAVISTSGTAPANHLPAIVEADMALAPLVAISADRPSELRGVGANQTIDQVGIFGAKVRYSVDIEAPGADQDSNQEWRRVVSEAVSSSLGANGRPGPVHLNIAFREPTVPVTDDGRSSSTPYTHPIDGAPDGGPWLRFELPVPPEPQIEIPASSRGLVIAGDGAYDRSGLLATATGLGWPVLATALSGLRGQGTSSCYHHLFAAGIPEHMQPDVVVAVGGIGPSERLEHLITSARLRFRVDASGRTIDPGRNATSVVHADPVRVLGATVGGSGDEAWVQGWESVDAETRRMIEDYIGGLVWPTGAGVATALNSAEWDSLVVASSLPIREVDAHLTRPGRVLANRGASGIDGFVSTALGISSVDAGVVAVSGDLSLLHDGNGFITDADHDMVMVVIDNKGGGLFDSLPQAAHAPHFERAFITPPGRRLDRLASFHDLGYSEIEDVTELPALIADRREAGGVQLIRIPVDRQWDLATRRALDQIGSKVAGSAEF